MRRLLVINADDFGYSDERNQGILECYKLSAVTSVSLMVNGVSVQNAVNMIKEHNISAGLHVNLTEGLPVGKRTYKTLTNQEGFFHGMMGFREKVGELNVDEVREEIQAQIDKFKELVGKNPQHADGHQHVHIIPEVLATFASLLEDNGIKVTRIPVEDNIEAHHWNDDQLAYFMGLVVQQGREAIPVFKQHNLWTSNLYLGLMLMGSDFASEMTVTNVKKAVSELFDQSSSQEKKSAESEKEEEVVCCEWMVHPGYKTKDKGGCGDGADDFSRSPDRENEMKVLCDTNLEKHFENLGLELVDFYSMYKLMAKN